MVKGYYYLTGIALILLAGFQWLGTILGWWTLSAVMSYVPFLIFTAMVGVFLWGYREKIETVSGKTVVKEVNEVKQYVRDLNFLHLVVYYSRIQNMPDTPENANTRYIINDKTTYAFRIPELPDWFSSEIKEHRMRWCSYDSDKNLNAYIKSKFSIGDSPSPKDLGLQLVNREWKEDNQNSDLLSNLKGKKLDLQIAELERRYFLGVKRRILLIDPSAKEVWQAPSCYYDLVQNKIVGSQTYGMRFYEDCGDWSRRFLHYSFTPLQYPESKLIARAKSTTS
jgi:hypothetical protein